MKRKQQRKRSEAFSGFGEAKNLARMMGVDWRMGFLDLRCDCQHDEAAGEPHHEHREFALEKTGVGRSLERTG